MAPAPNFTPLLVCDYDGSSRSGKGSIIGHLSEILPQEVGGEVRVEATGVCYRALAHLLLQEGELKLSSTTESINKDLSHIDEDDARKMLTSTSGDLIEAYGEDVLYGDKVNKVVPLLSRVIPIRQAVRGGFGERLATLAELKPSDPNRPRAVLTDGRNLRQIIKEVPNTKLLLNHFVTCSAEEAARRECLRRGVMPESNSGVEILRSIKARNHTDRTNPFNPGKPDSDALIIPSSREDDPTKTGFAAGSKGRQVHFDTTILSKDRMVEIASDIVRGALKSLQT